MGIYFQNQRIDNKEVRQVNNRVEDCHYFSFKTGSVDSNGRCDVAYTTSAAYVENYYEDFYHTGGDNKLIIDNISGGDINFWTKFLNGEQVSFPNGANYSAEIIFANEIKLTSLNLRTIYGYRVCQALDQFYVYTLNSQNEWIEIGGFNSGAVKPETKYINNNNQFYTSKIKLVAKDLTDQFAYPGVATELKLNLFEKVYAAEARYLYFKITPDTPLIGVFGNGEKFTKTYLKEVDCSTLSDGTYNIFIGESDEPLVLDNNVYKQKNVPTNVNNDDVWVNTSVLPYIVKKYEDGTWVDFNYVQLPQQFITQDGYILAVINSGYYNNNLNSLDINITDFYVVGDNGYKVWSNGYKEQWGKQNFGTNINFMIPFTGTDYYINANQPISSSGTGNPVLTIQALTNSGATLIFPSATNYPSNDWQYSWFASGF